MSTFTHDAAIRWDKARNYSHHRDVTGESASALKKGAGVAALNRAAR